MRRVIIILLAVLIVSGGVFAWRAQSQAPDAAEEAVSLVQDETVARIDDLSVTVSATGTIAPIKQAGLRFELPGTVAEVYVVEGQSVSAGEVLARLDTRELENALEDARLIVELQQIAYEALTAPARDVDIAVAEAAVTAAQASVNAAFGSQPSAQQQEIARLQAELARNQLWQAQLGRDLQAQSPFPSAGGGTSESSLLQTELGVEIADTNAAGVINQGPNVGSLASANAAVVSARAQLDRLLNGPSDFDLQTAQLNVQSAQLAVELAEANMRRTELVAPFDAVIALINLKVGEPAPTTEAAIQLIDPSSYYVDVAIDETDIVDLQPGQTVSLTLDALPEVMISGQVTRINPTATILSQVVTFPVRILLYPTLEPIRSGMNTTASIVIRDLQDALVIANRFIRIDRGTQEAFVTVQRENNRFEEIEVTLGLRNETQTQIVSGLEDGDRVVLLPRESFDFTGGP